MPPWSPYLLLLAALPPLLLVSTFSYPWCPEPDSNRRGPFRVLGILSPTISLSTNIHRNLKRGLQGDSRYGVCVCLLLNLTRLATAMGTTRAAHFLRLFVNQWKRDHRKPPIKAHAKAETTKTPMEQERSILNSVHGIEDGQAEVSLNTCENPLCRTKYQPTCLPWVKQRYCSDPCRQQMSIIRRAAKLFEPVPRLRVLEILRGG